MTGSIRKAKRCNCVFSYKMWDRQGCNWHRPCKLCTQGRGTSWTGSRVADSTSERGQGRDTGHLLVTSKLIEHRRHQLLAHCRARAGRTPSPNPTSVPGSPLNTAGNAPCPHVSPGLHCRLAVTSSKGAQAFCSNPNAKRNEKMYTKAVEAFWVENSWCAAPVASGGVILACPSAVPFTPSQATGEMCADP